MFYKMNITEEELDRRTCQTCEKVADADYELHTCPFKSDMYNDQESLCNCCERCTEACKNDI